MGPANAVAVAPELLTVAVLLGTGLAAFLSYKRGGDKAVSAGEAATQVVAATFTEREQMERLIQGVLALNGTLADAQEVTSDLVALLKSEAQHRHDQAVIRDALRARGIVE